ncbi:MAG TPA: hypothetical protein VGY13_01415 [Solirubrobacteraceae bacterium]|nr:hypothetical protein [Solirubrobacteraceae bacterium]
MGSSERASADGRRAPERAGPSAPAPARRAAPPAGLCERCSHQRVVRNTRGSSFSLCERSRSDPAFPRYPRLPVLECAGFEPRAQAAG